MSDEHSDAKTVSSAETVTEQRKKMVAVKEQSAVEYNDLSSTWLSAMAMSVLLLQLDYTALIHANNPFFLVAQLMYTHTRFEIESNRRVWIDFVIQIETDFLFNRVVVLCSIGSHKLSLDSFRRVKFRL